MKTADVLSKYENTADGSVKLKTLNEEELSCYPKITLMHLSDFTI